MDGYAQLETSIIEKVGITAAALYALIKRRWQLSCANGSKWQDSKGVFCRMARKEMCALLHKSRPTITKAMRALRRAGLLSEKRVGLGATNKIYLHLQRHKFCMYWWTSMYPSKRKAYFARKKTYEN